MSSCFGKTTPTKLDKYIEQAVDYCRCQNPEALDKIFDNRPVELNDKVLKDTVKTLKQDIDSLS